MIGAPAQVVVTLDDHERATVTLGGVLVVELSGAPMSHVLGFLTKYAAVNGIVSLTTRLPSGAELLDFVRPDGSIVSAAPNPGRREVEVPMTRRERRAMESPVAVPLNRLFIPEIGDNDNPTDMRVDQSQLKKPPADIPTQRRPPEATHVFEQPIVTTPASLTGPSLPDPVGEAPSEVWPEREVADWSRPLGEKTVEIDLEAEMAGMSIDEPRLFSGKFIIKAAVIIVAMIALVLFVLSFTPSAQAAVPQASAAPSAARLQVSINPWLVWFGISAVVLALVGAAGAIFLRNRRPKV